ncbi:MAG: ATP-binding protein [Saprospiraceae bacterium]
MEHIDLDNIFFPSQHISDPKWFAGRKDDIEKALQSLCTAGASMLVYGERGAGKTSFVEMIKQIAEGKSYFLFNPRYNFHKRFPQEKFKFKIISTICDEETNTTSRVLQCLITDPKDGIRGLLTSRMEKIESTIKSKYTLDFLKLFAISREEEEKKSAMEFKEDFVFEKFSNLLKIIASEVLNPYEGLLIIIDEFDQVKDSSKMASLIKKLSTGNVKFLLSGIAEQYDQLLSGHSSVNRQLFNGRINIRLMTDDEIREVFKLVTENTKDAIRFEKSFVDEVIEKSNRFPYFVQLFGKLSLDAYYKEKGYHTPMIIHNQHLKTGLKKIGLNEEQMEQDYLSIIKDNPLKELAIKFLAKQTANKISDEEIFTCFHKKGVMGSQPKNTLTSLLSSREPHFLIREREDSEYVLFKNKLFKTFVNIREPELIRQRDNDFYLPKELTQIKKVQ